MPDQRLAHDRRIERHFHFVLVKMLKLAASPLGKKSPTDQATKVSKPMRQPTDATTMAMSLSGVNNGGPEGVTRPVIPLGGRFLF